jgi:hypothetical protein
MINYVINATYYSAIFFMIFLAIKFSYELMRHRKEKYLKSFRLILNFAALLFYCGLAFFSFAIIVQRPDLKWFHTEELKLAAIGLCILIVLAGLNYFYQVKIEKIKSPSPVIRLSIINSLILSFVFCLIHIYFPGYYW